MVVVTFDKLYENYNTLTEAQDKVSEYASEYLEVIESTKGDTKMKLLTTKIIPTFFKHFPSLQNQAIDALFDMCEEEDSKIRCAAMRALPSMCKGNKELIAKVADIIAQLLQLEDQVEYNVASSSLYLLFIDDITTVVKCIFKQINEADNLVREKCIKFFVAKIKVVDKALVTLEVEDLIISEVKKVLQDATGEEFSQLMTYLVSTKFAQSFTGMQELVDIAAEQAELDVDFDPFDEDTNFADRFITCTKFVLPFFSVKIDSARFVKYICDQILPQWDNVRTECKCHILQQLAELSVHCGPLVNPKVHIVHIFEKLKEALPEPPEDTSTTLTTTTTLPTYDFILCETLLYSFHALARQSPELLTSDASLLRSFRARLMYCARAVQGCLRVIEGTGTEGAVHVNTAEERRKREMAPVMLSNISVLIKDLFYSPPQYRCRVQLSFKQRKGEQPVGVVGPVGVQHRKSTEMVTNKRHIPITFDSNGGAAGAGATNKHLRTNRSGDNVKMYTPPSGKFSNNFNNYEDRKSGGGRFRGGRGGRGSRGRGRGWRP